MRLSPRRHEFICVFLLGAGTLFLYLSYSVQAFIGENVIHTISERYPGRIFRLAGYYGQAIHYTAFAISSLITPSIQTYVRSKWILAMGSLLFALYYVGFVQVNSIYFFISQALMGIGYSFYNNGEGAYLSEHSSSETVESNTGIETAVGHSSMFVGGGALALIFYLISPSKSSGEIATQSYTDTQIRLIYGTLLGLNMMSFVIFACLPTKEYDSIASTSPTVIPSLRKQFGKFKSAMKEVNMLLLLPFFGYMGLIVSFLIGVYPTTLAFTESLKSDVYIVALYSVGAGTAEIFGGVVLRRILLKFKDWGLVMMISTHFLAVSTALILVLLSVPEMATIQPTNEPTLLIKPSRVIVVIIGFLLGMGDFTITTGRAVICQVAVPKARMQVFSMSRLYQCVLACAFLFLTPYMKTTYWVIVLGFFLITGSTTFGIVAKRTAHLRRNVVSPCEDAKSKDRGETADA